MYVCMYVWFFLIKVNDILFEANFKITNAVKYLKKITKGLVSPQ